MILFCHSENIFMKTIRFLWRFSMLNKFDMNKFINDFLKGEVITTYLVNRNQLCILISGTADLVRYDINRK